MNEIKKIILGIILLGSILIIAVSNSYSNQDKISKTDKIDELVSTYAEYGKFNGSILISEGNKVIYKKGFGFANMEWDIPNQPDTKHRIASISKQFTAMLILQLAAQDKLDLHAPISNYLPEYPKEKADIITVHHLLTHSSGTPDYARFPNYRDFERKRHRPQEIIDLFADLPLEFEPGERYDYCNSGYILLGVIIENITGKRYGNVIQENILDPLKMKNTGFDSPWTVLKNRSNGYYKRWGKHYNASYMDMSLVYAAGALYSTVEDLYLWDQALYTEKLLPQEYMDLMFSGYVETRGRMYGYGWFIADLPGHDNQKVQSISHGGGMDGVRTLITRIPSNQSLIVLLCNTEEVDLREMTHSINNILHEQPYDFPKKSVATSLLEIVKNEGIDKTNSFYNNVKNDTGYYIDENEMVVAGYDLLHSGQAKKAAAIFKLSIDAFPDSYNVYDSYGEALKELGEKEEAIKYYKKSVELNPNNKNGVQMLRELGVMDE